MCFGTAAFNTDISQHAILYPKETHKNFSTSQESIENNCSIKTGAQRWNRLL